MPELVNLRLFQANDETLHVTVKTDEQPSTPWDLSEVDNITMVIKPTAASPDGDGITLIIGNGITVTDAEAGELEIDITRLMLASTDTRWYRLDLTQASRLRTILYGRLTVTDT
ncbi:hypothetical protein [Actinocorallia longicatena]|uniref:Uncharacterized protein n=1 Tax=Actinocorallia longicatena TaxID=111803 RepID=A0ABP6QHV2_9ACTN